jgi:hypothetical protein
MRRAISRTLDPAPPINTVTVLYWIAGRFLCLHFRAGSEGCLSPFASKTHCRPCPHVIGHRTGISDTITPWGPDGNLSRKGYPGHMFTILVNTPCMATLGETVSDTVATDDSAQSHVTPPLAQRTFAKLSQVTLGSAHFSPSCHS